MTLNSSAKPKQTQNILDEVRVVNVSPHRPTMPCSTRFQERVFDSDMRYAGRNLCRCCGRLMAGRRSPDANSRGIPDPLCVRCIGHGDDDYGRDG